MPRVKEIFVSQMLIDSRRIEAISEVFKREQRAKSVTAFRDSSRRDIAWASR